MDFGYHRTTGLLGGLFPAPFYHLSGLFPAPLCHGSVFGELGRTTEFAERPESMQACP